MKIVIPISIGELLDKISILQIKSQFTDNSYVIKERDVPFQPDSMRISGFQSHMASRLNEPRIQFTSEEIENAYQEIIQKIEGDNKLAKISKTTVMEKVSYN